MNCTRCGRTMAAHPTGYGPRCRAALGITEVAIPDPPAARDTRTLPMPWMEDDNMRTMDDTAPLALPQDDGESERQRVEAVRREHARAAMERAMATLDREGDSYMGWVQP